MFEVVGFKEGLETKIGVLTEMASLVNNTVARRALMLHANNGLGPMVVKVAKQFPEGEITGWDDFRPVTISYARMLLDAIEAKSNSDGWILVNTEDVEDQKLRDSWLSMGVGSSLIAIVQSYKAENVSGVRFLSLHFEEDFVDSPDTRREIQTRVDTIRNFYEDSIVYKSPTNVLASSKVEKTRTLPIKVGVGLFVLQAVVLLLLALLASDVAIVSAPLFFGGMAVTAPAVIKASGLSIGVSNDKKS